MNAPPKTKRAAPTRATRDSTTAERNDTSTHADAQAAKQLAISLYNASARSLVDTAVAFAQHPEWVQA